MDASLIGYLLLGVAVVILCVVVVVYLLRRTNSTFTGVQASDIPNVETSDTPKPVLQRKDMCYPGCNFQKCSIQSMYEGGAQGGMCSRKECSQPEPRCCCYDFQCSGCK